MDYSDNKNKTKMKKLVCEKYITVDSKEKIEFKSFLNDAIGRGDISDDDALSISLELMFGIKNYNYNYKDVYNSLNELVLKVKEYNLSVSENIKNSILFFHNYDFECEVLSEYIEELCSKSIIDDENNKLKKNKPKHIKKYFDHFSREDLCNILGKNPDLNFDKEKKLKNQIAIEFSKYDFDPNRLVDVSSDDIKKYLEDLKKESAQNQPSEVLKSTKRMQNSIENTEKKAPIKISKNESIQEVLFSNKNQKKNKKQVDIKKSNENSTGNSLNSKQHNIIKSEDNHSINKEKVISQIKSDKKFKDLLQKVKLFNNYRRLQSMISLMSEYSQIYQEISARNLDAINEEFKKFRYFYENFGKVVNSVRIIDKLNQKEDLIDEFHQELTYNPFFNSNMAISKYKDLYGIFYPIKEYPYFLKDKIFEQIDNLEFFIKNYELLLEEHYPKTDKYNSIEWVGLIEKINLFNNKKLDEMVSSKKEYSEIYQEISEMKIDSSKEHYVEFLVFMDNYEYCNELSELLNKIKLNKHFIDDFFTEINKEELSNYRRNELISDFKEFYHLSSQVYSYPEGMEFHIFDELNNLELFIEYYDDLLNEGNFIKEINIKNEIYKNEAFFKDIKDLNKKRAIVCDEDNVRVIAGAGAGKTFIIQKKIEYLIKKRTVGTVEPEKILCLCYTGKGANDLREKINNEKVNIFTFHGFCREVSKKCDEYRPTDDKLLDDVINNYIRKVIDDDDRLNEILEYFSYYVKNPTEHEFDTIEEYNEFKNGFGLKTLRNKYDFYNGYQKQSYNGEVVRSLEELVIANFLFMHEIDYIYEDSYQHEYLARIINYFFASYNYFCLNRDLSNDLNNLKQFEKFEKSLEAYQPDFYLPDKKIYIEHFGVSRDNVAHWLKGDAQKKYTEDMNFKLELHKLYNTNLITTFSYFMTEGILLDKLRESLSDYFDLHERDKKKIFNIIINNNRSEDFKHFKNLLKSFINIFEAKNLPKSMLDDFKKENSSQENIYLKRKHELFLNIVSEIYEDYDTWNQKGGLYYNREITHALNLIESGDFKECYDYIFIDEYQDINYVRCKLLQELQKINNSKLFVVGDDWQSIYGFNGSEVNLFVDFDEYFPNSKTIKISENRRNCQALIDISSKFIRQNENQEEKKLEYYKKDQDTNFYPIKLVPYDKKENKILYVEKIIQEIIFSNPKKNLKVLLLGRKNNDINFLINNRLFKQVYGDKKYKKIVYSKNSNITIYFMSIHQSKGLETDEVIILNFENYDYGFPNQVDDDSVLHFIKEKEDYLFAEERRLLYVALTRTRNNVYLVYPNSNYSTFIKELKNDFKLEESLYKIQSNDLSDLYKFNHFYSGNDYKFWYYNSIPIPIEDVDYYFKIVDEGFLNEIELELFIWYEYMLNYNDPLENAFKQLVGFNEGTKSNLIDKSLKMKGNIIHKNISVLVNNKKCNFTISGIGPKSVRFTKRIIFDNENIKKEYAENILRQYNIPIEDLERLLDI